MKLKNIFCISVLVSLSWNASGQSNFSVDKLSNEEIYKNPKITHPEELKTFKQRYDLATKNNDKNQQYELSKYVAMTLHRLNQTKDIFIWENKIDSLSLLVETIPYDKEFELYKISRAYYNNQMVKALDLIDAMKPLAISSQDTTWIIKWYCKSILANIKQNDKAEALKAIVEAEGINNQNKTEYQTALLLYVRGALNYILDGKRKESLENAIQSSDIFLKLKDSDMVMAAYRNIINVASDDKNKKLMLEYSEKLSNLNKKTGSQIGYYNGEVGRIFEFILLDMYQEAIDLADKTIAYGVKTNRKTAHPTYLKGVAYRGFKKYAKAAILINKAFDMSLETQNNGQSSYYSHALYQTYYWDDKFEPALEWYITHISYRDSVRTEKKLKEIAVLEAQLESLDHKRNVELLKAKVALEKQTKKGMYIAIFLGILLAMALQYSQYQKSRRQKAIQKAKLIQSNLEKEKLEQQLEFKQRELASQILNMVHKNSLLHEVTNHITDLKDETNNHSVNRVLRLINRNIDNKDEWEQFISTFKSIHSSFLNKLFERNENLTSSEIRFASLLKMNLSSKEIASMLNISSEGVKKARYRLRKKIGLESGVNIQDYLLGM